MRKYGERIHVENVLFGKDRITKKATGKFYSREFESTIYTQSRDILGEEDDGFRHSLVARVQLTVRKYSAGSFL